MRALSDGMAVEFIDLSETQRQILHEQVELRSDGHAVKLWFEGLAQPIVARAALVNGSIKLRTALPFLRVEAPVSFAAANQPDEMYEGKLHGISMQANPGRPAIIELTIQRSRSRAHGRPEPLVVEMVAPHAGEVEGAEARAARALTEDFEISEEEMGAPEEVIHAKGSGPEGMVLTAVGPEPTAGRRSAPDPEKDPWFSQAVAEDGATFVEESLAPKRRGGRWLLAAAVCAAGLGSLYQFSPQVQSVLFKVAGSSPTEPVAAAAPAEAQPVAAQAAQAPVATAPVEAAPVATAPVAGPVDGPRCHAPRGRARRHAATAINTDPVAAPPPALPRGVTVTEKDGTVEVRVATEGDLADLTSYPLAAPDGFAINLPTARARTTPGNYWLSRGGVSQLWVRTPTDGGQQLRVFFSPARPTTVERTATGLKITVRPAPLAAAPQQ